MATKTDFTPEESTLLRAAPVLAGLRVAVADHGGNFDEVAAIAEAYGAAHERLWSTPPPPAELVELTRVHTLGAELAPVAELTPHRRRWRLAGADELSELVDDYAVARWEG